jgi:hypothetical protein
MEPSNITSGFIGTGIPPFTPHIFIHDEMAAARSSQAGRPDANTSQKDEQKFNKTLNKQPLPGSSNVDSNSGTNSHSIKVDVHWFSCTKP